MKVFISL